MATLEWEVLDTSGVEWEVLDGTVVSWSVERGPVEITGGGGGVSLASAAPAALAAAAAVGVGTTAARADHVHALPAADQVKARDIYQPGLVMSPAAVSAFGGSMVNGVSLTIAALSSFPTGTDILIWNGTAGGAPNGSYTHTSGGSFTYSARQYLTFASVANGCTAVLAKDYVSTDAAAEQSMWAITTADGTNYGLTPIGGYASEVTLIDGYTDQHHDALTAAKYATDPPAAWFVFSGNQPTNDAWTTGDIPELTGMPDMRALVYFERDVVEQFSEILTRWFDADGAAEDSPELAIYKPTPNAQPRIYVESVRDGGTTDESDINVEFDLEGVWMPIRAFYNSTGTLCTAQVGVRWDGDSTTSGRHTEWRTIATAARPAGIEWNVANDWIMGLHFEGRIAWVELYDGADGTLVAAPDATDWTTGTSFTDSEGNTWATTTGTVESSLDARVDALDTAVAARVPTTRTLAGLDLSANRTAAALRTALDVAPAPRLQPTGQYVASGNIASTNTGLTSNRLYHVPVLIPRDMTITRIGVNQAATGSAGAGSVGRFGIYNNTGDLPAAAFDLPSATIDLTTGTGLKFVSGTWVLTAGIWWFSFVAQVTSGSPTFATSPPAIVVPSSDTTNNGSKFEGGVTGTLPATATPGAANTTGIPIIFLYV